MPAVLRLEQAGAVALERNNKGFIVAAHVRGEQGANPIRTGPGKGDKYSFQSFVGQVRVWELKHLAGGTGKTLAPVEAREAYLGVVQSVLKG